MYHHTHIITRWKGTHSFRKSDVARLLSSVFFFVFFPLIHPVKVCTNHKFSFSVTPCFTFTQGGCSVQPLSTTTGPEPLHWDRPGLSSLLKGFSLVVTDGGESMPCSFPCPCNTSDDLGVQWKKGSGLSISPFFFNHPSSRVFNH